MPNWIKQIRLYHIILFFSLIAGWPCVFYLLGWLPHYTVNYTLLFVFCLIWIIFHPKVSVPHPIIKIFLANFIMWFIYCVGFRDTSYLTRLLYLAIVFIIIVIENYYNKRAFLYIFIGWITLQVILGILGFALTVSGMLEPIFTFEEMDSRTGYFFGLFTTNTYFPPFVRVAGFFDEPGAFACWGIFALLLNKLFVNNKKIEYILLLGLLDTLSIAYIVQAVLYIVLFMGANRFKLVLIIILSVCSLQLLSSISPEFKENTFGRFEYDETTKSFVGDNRSDLSAETSKIFINSPLFGVGARNLNMLSERKNQFFGANPYTPLARDGIVGLVISLLPFFYILGLRKIDRKYKYAVLIILVGFLQRPYDPTQLLYPLLIYTFLLYTYFTAKQLK